MSKNKSEYLINRKDNQYEVVIGLEVHAGHGLTFQTAKIIGKIKYITELNIGHFIISESIFIGLRNSIKKFNLSEKNIFISIKNKIINETR